MNNFNIPPPGLGWRPSNQPQQTQQDRTRQELNRLQRRNNGLDVEGVVRAAGVEGFQEPLPPLDLQWLAQSDTQAFFALTISSQRGGANMQRGKVEEAHMRQASSEGTISHARDELILSFDIEKQTNHQVWFPQHNMLHVNYLDREIIAPYLGNNLFLETSAVDPTIVQQVQGYPPISNLSVVRIAGTDFLVVCTTEGAYFISNIYSNPPVQTGPVIFKTPAPVVGFTGPFLLVPPPAGSSVGNSGGSAVAVTVWPWWGGQTQSQEFFIAQSISQSYAPGNPMIVRTSSHILQAPVEDGTGGAVLTGDLVSIMLKNVGLGNAQPLGWIAVSGRDLRLYFWETNYGGPVSGGSTFRSRLSSVDSSGYLYRVHELSMSKIIGCVPIRQRGAIAVEDGYHVVLWDGRERDLGLFADESPSPGFTLFCVGLYELEGQLTAEIAELPSPDSTHGFGAGVGRGRIRTCKRRYDFELRRWSQVSTWEVFTTDGLIRWDNGIPLPVANTAENPIYGYMPAFGAPDLPWGKVTRYQHNFAMAARYKYDLSTGIPYPSPTPFTWYKKFEPPASVNPYSFRGSKPFAPLGKSRSPGLIFPGRARWANKYFDAIEWLGQDTGGAGSEFTIHMGEFGHLDDVDSDGNRKVISRTFRNGLSHDQRRFTINRNQTAIMVPQFDFEILRGSLKYTLQGFPITIYGHVDFVPTEFPAVQTSTGRSSA